MTTGTVLYLHGFLSSPASIKVQLLADGLKAHPEWWPGVKFLAPDLNRPPKEVDALLKTIEREENLVGVMGSSFGGFWAARVANRAQVPAVLLNPCVRPWTYLETVLGVHTIYGTDRQIEVTPQHLADLEALNEATPHALPEGFPALVVLSDKDEVLDYRIGQQEYAKQRQWVLPGETHRIDNFAPLVEPLFRFLKDAQPRV